MSHLILETPLKKITDAAGLRRSRGQKRMKPRIKKCSRNRGRLALVKGLSTTVRGLQSLLALTE